MVVETCDFSENHRHQGSKGWLPWGGEPAPLMIPLDTPQQHCAPFSSHVLLVCFATWVAAGPYAPRPPIRWLAWIGHTGPHPAPSEKHQGFGCGSEPSNASRRPSPKDRSFPWVNSFTWWWFCVVFYFDDWWILKYIYIYINGS